VRFFLFRSISLCTHPLKLLGRVLCALSAALGCAWLPGERSPPPSSASCPGRRSAAKAAEREATQGSSRLVPSAERNLSRGPDPGACCDGCLPGWHAVRQAPHADLESYRGPESHLGLQRGGSIAGPRLGRLPDMGSLPNLR
jgi:hypothetical protein